MPAKTENSDERVKRVQVSASLTPDEFAAVDAARWAQRHDKRSDLVREAIRQYVIGTGGDWPTEA